MCSTTVVFRVITRVIDLDQTITYVGNSEIESENNP